jgi:hypothetical protein
MSATDEPDMYNSPAMKKHAASVMNTVGAAVRLTGKAVSAARERLVERL